MSKAMPRRLASVVGGLALGLAGTVALAAPASAEVVVAPGPAIFDSGNVTTALSLCAGSMVLVGTGTGVEALPGWRVSLDGELVWPREGELDPSPGESVLIFVPPGVVTVGIDGNPELLVHTWEEPAFCAGLPQPTAAQPTCDGPGSITIPALPDADPILEGLDGFEPPPQAVVTPRYQLDGVDVDPESTHVAETGIHVVSLHLLIEQRTILGFSLDLPLETWVFEIGAPDCPGEDDGEDQGDGDDQGDGGDQGADHGEAGGELPKTGVPAGLVAGSAAVLMLLGAGLYLLARRRRTTFTA